MKKTKLPVILVLALLLVFLFAFTASTESEQPVVTLLNDASIRIDSEDHLGLRFTTQVQLPLPDGAKITEQGTLIVPLYVNGENDFTLETENVLKIKKAEDEFFSTQKTHYEYTAVLENIPVYHMKSPLCARSYLTYTLGRETKTVYSEIVIQDAYSVAKELYESSPESDVAQEAKARVLDLYDQYIADVDNYVTEDIRVTAPVAAEGEEIAVVYPYVDDAKTYLQSGNTGAESNLVNYKKYNDAAKAIDITWTDSVQGAKSYTVMYATKADYSDAKFAWSTTDDCKVSLYNLYKDTTYYVMIIANGDQPRTVKMTFKTTDLGPRVIHLDGSCNARDLGGYASSLGGTTKQGLIYRSSQYDDYGSYDATITVFGKYAVQNDLGLVTELDFRNGMKSALPGTNYKVIPVYGYDLANKNYDNSQEYIKQVFEFLADESNYPVIFHCQGGADRTGTIAYLFNGLLGVSPLDLAHDYEFTSYSAYGLRHMNSTSYIGMVEDKLKDDGVTVERYSYDFFKTLGVNNYMEITQEKVEAYLLNIGVTADQIASIKSIMLDQAS